MYSYATSAVALKDRILYITYSNMDDKNHFYYFYPETNMMEEVEMKVAPESRIMFSLASVQGEIYLVGGIPKGEYEGHDDLSKGIWKLNEDFVTWEKVGETSVARFNPIVASIGDKLIITGGRWGDFDYLTTTEIFDGSNIIQGQDLPFSGMSKENVVTIPRILLYYLTHKITIFSSYFIISWQCISLRYKVRKIYRFFLIINRSITS